MVSLRLRRRLRKHHIPLGLGALGGGSLFYLASASPDGFERLSFASAYPALFFLTATLLIGPLKLASGGRVGVSLDLRRDVGIWAGLVGLFHVVIGQCVHLRGRPWLYYIYEDWQADHVQPLRHDVFGAANYTGLLAAIVLVTLLATSNDRAVRKLGVKRWKAVQRWNYACFGMMTIHALLYQMAIENQHWTLISLALGSAAVTGSLQIAGLRRWRRAGARA